MSFIELAIRPCLYVAPHDRAWTLLGGPYFLSNSLKTGALRCHLIACHSGHVHCTGDAIPILSAGHRPREIDFSRVWELRLFPLLSLLVSKSSLVEALKFTARGGREYRGVNSFSPSSNPNQNIETFLSKHFVLKREKNLGRNASG